MDSTLDKVMQALAGVDDRVYYGTAADHPKGATWDYTVFSRSATRVKENITGFSDVFIVSVVRESYVSSETLFEVVDAMCAIPGMKLDAANDIEYVYDVKPNTRRTVEMMIVRFVKARKR